MSCQEQTMLDLPWNYYIEDGNAIIQGNILSKFEVLLYQKLLLLLLQ